VTVPNFSGSGYLHLRTTVILGVLLGGRWWAAVGRRIFSPFPAMLHGRISDLAIRIFSVALIGRELYGPATLVDPEEVWSVLSPFIDLSILSLGATQT